MDMKYVLGGAASLILGLYIIVKQIRTIRAGQQDSLGWDYRLLIGGVIFLMLGIGMIAQNL